MIQGAKSFDRTSVSRDELIGWAWRDVHAAVSQIGLAWDIQATNYGRVTFGLPLMDPKI